LVTDPSDRQGRVLGVSIDDSLVEEPFEKSMLEDLVAAAFNDARAKPTPRPRRSSTR